MKKTHKILTVLLTLCMVCVLSSASAFAAAPSPAILNPELVFSPQTTLSVFVDGEASDVLTDNYPYGESVSVTAPDITGKTFRYWTNAEGSIISYDSNLTLNMYTNTAVNAVYGDSAETSAPIAAFVNVTRTDGEIIFNAIGSGIRYSTTKSTLEDLQGTDGVTVETATGSSNWTFTVTPEDENTVYYAVVYKTGGETTYSEVKAVKLSELESGISMVISLGDISLPDIGAGLCSVTFDPNGGNGVMAPQGMVKGRATALSANSFTHESSAFSGWSTSPSGGGTRYTNGQTVTLNGNITLYAQWGTGIAPTGGGSSTPASTAVTVPVSGEDATVNVNVEVKDSTATIKSADVEKVLEAKDVGTVTIDVSGLNNNVNEATIPGAMVDKIATAVADEKNDANGLEIKLPTGTVSLDKEAVEALSEQAGSNDLTLHLDGVKVTELNTAQQGAVKDIEVEVVLDAYLTSNGQRISDFKGGSATVKVPYTLKSNQRATGLVVWYVADDGTRTQIPARYENNEIIFTVPHFSNYVIAYDAEKAKECPKDAICPLTKFKDLKPSAWYHDGIHYCLERGMMNGVGDDKFSPNGNTSRAMLVTILYRMENEPAVTATNPFSDVAYGQWYTNAVIWASENKIVEGYDGRFSPNAPITREQFSAILYRYAQSKGKGFTGTWMFNLDYPDASKVSDWANEAMHWCVMNGIINGKDGNLVPGGNASRAEAATMLMRFLQMQ